MLNYRDLREEAIFQYWLDKRVLQRRGVSAVGFKRLCDAGEIRGFAFKDWDPAQGDATAPSPVLEMGRPLGNPQPTG